MPIGAAVAAVERLEERVLLSNTPATLANIEDVRGPDGRTYLVGDIVDSTPAQYGRYDIEIDLDADGSVDVSATYSSGATKFVWAVSAEGPPGTIYYASVTITEKVENDPWLVSGPTIVGYEIQPPDNVAPTLRFAEFTDVFDPIAGGTTRTVRGQLRDYTRTYDQYTVECDLDGDGTVDATLHQVSANEVFSFDGLIGPGSGDARLRISEANDAGIPLILDWVAANKPGDVNDPPVFGDPGSRVLGYGGLESGLVVATIPASDPDDTQLKYSIYQPWLPGHGSDGNFYDMIPAPALSIDGNGQVTISNPEVIQYLYKEHFQFNFGVVADDGHTTDSVSFTLYDDFEYWIDEAKDYLDEWGDWYGNVMIDGTAMQAMAALQAFKSDVGLEWLTGVATAVTSVAWATAPASAGASAAGMSITGLALQAIADGFDAETAAFMMELQDRVNQVRYNDHAHLTTFLLAEKSETNGLATQLRDSGESPAEKARQAKEKLRSLQQQFRMRDAQGNLLPGPSFGQVYGPMLLNYAVHAGYSVYWMPAPVDPEGNPSPYGMWMSNDIPSPGWTNGRDYAERLNEIGYNPNFP